jgi:hypothetical protein
VSLTSTPIAAVTLLLKDESGQLHLSALTLNFDPGQPPNKKTVTVNAVSDLIAEPTRTVVLELVAVSADPVYAGLTLAINVRVLDDDVPGVIVHAFPQVVAEMDTLTLSVTLSSVPKETVVITLSSTSPGGGAGHDLQATSLTFQAADWASRQSNKTVRHSIHHDRVVTGDFSMPISVAVGGSDVVYLGIGPVPDVQVRYRYRMVQYMSTVGGIPIYRFMAWGLKFRLLILIGYRTGTVPVLEYFVVGTVPYRTCTVPYLY